MCILTINKIPREKLSRAHPKHYYFLDEGFSLCERALPAILLVLALDFLSCRAFEALVATDAEVTFLAITEAYPSFSGDLSGGYPKPPLYKDNFGLITQLKYYLSLPIGTSKQKALPFFG